MSLLVQGVPQWIGWTYGAVALVAAITDFRTGKIYNWLTLPALLVALALSSLFGTDKLVAALSGFAFATVLFLPLFFLRILGGGDVKLMMALGAVVGPKGVWDLTVVSFFIAGSGSLILLFVHRRAKIFFKQVWLFLKSLFIPGLEIHWPKLSFDIRAPFGPAIFVAFLAVWLGAV